MVHFRRKHLANQLEAGPHGFGGRKTHVFLRNVELHKIEDFKGQELRCNKSPIAEETLSSVGAIPVPIELEQINEGVQNGIIWVVNLHIHVSMDSNKTSL